jgi:hypothetical protein
MILKDSGITGKMWDLLKENSRKMRIRVLHPSIKADSEVNVLRGLPEGSRLSPILFAIFAADLIRDLQLQFPEITMPTATALTWMGTIFYVDDAVLIARSPEELQLMLNACQQWAEKNRMSINVNKTKIVVFLEDPGTRKARQRFNFTLTPAFPTSLPEATRIQMRQEVLLRKHTTSAIKESVRIPASSLGLVVKVKENDTAIIEVAGLGQVELRVQDLTNVSLVISEVDCFKYLGLNLDYALRMEEATKAGVANIRFAHSKVSATLHSLHQLPRRGNNAALSPLMRLQMWRSCVLTQALENLRYLRTKGQVKQWQAALSLSLKRTFGHFEQPLPMSLDLGIPPLALLQAKQLCQMHFRYTYGVPSIMPARLYALRVTHMRASPKDCMEHRIQGAYTALDMGALYPSLAPLPQSVSGNATRHKEKAYGRVLKTRVSEVWRQTVLRNSPRVTDGSPPQGRMAAFVNHLYDDLSRNLFTPAPYLRSFSADSAYYLFRIRTQDQNIIPTQEPRPNGVPQTQYGDRRCPLCPGRHLGSEAHLYLSCPVTSPLAHPLISEFRDRFPWDGFTQHQQMALLLGTMPQDSVDQRHKQWFRTMLPQCHALAARITLTVQKELQMLAVKTGVSAGQLRAAASASQGVASGALLQIPSPMTMSSEDEE